MADRIIAVPADQASVAQHFDFRHDDNGLSKLTYHKHIMFITEENDGLLREYKIRITEQQAKYPDYVRTRLHEMVDELLAYSREGK